MSAPLIARLDAAGLSVCALAKRLGEPTHRVQRWLTLPQQQLDDQLRRRIEEICAARQYARRVL